MQTQQAKHIFHGSKSFQDFQETGPKVKIMLKVQFKPHVLFFVPPGDPQVLDQEDTGAQCDHGKNQTPIKHKQYRKYFLTYVWPNVLQPVQRKLVLQLAIQASLA